MLDVIINYKAFFYLLSVGLMGALFNYLVQAVKGHIQCNFIDYFFGAISNTIGSSGSIALAAIGLMQAGPIDFESQAIFASMFAAGFTCDNVINKAPK